MYTYSTDGIAEVFESYIYIYIYIYMCTHTMVHGVIIVAVQLKKEG